MYKINDKLNKTLATTKGKVLISLLFTFLAVLISAGSFYIIVGVLNTKVDRCIKKSYYPLAKDIYSYYTYSSGSMITNERVEKLMSESVKNNKFNFVWNGNFSDISTVRRLEIIKKNLQKSQYSGYYNSVKKKVEDEYYSESFCDSFQDYSVESAIYYKHLYYSALPANYNKEVKWINDVYADVASAAKLDKSVDVYDFWEATEKHIKVLAKYSKDKQIQKYLASNCDFLQGYWSNDWYYFKLYTDDNGQHTSYNLPNDWNSMDYFTIQNGNYLLYNDGEDDNKHKVFKFTVIDADTLKVYCYSNDQSYVLKR